MKNNLQPQKQILFFESQLYSKQTSTQLKALESVQEELLNIRCVNHQNLLGMLAKFFASTSSIFLRIKIIELLEGVFGLTSNQVEWKPIIGYLQQECYCDNFYLRILSLRALQVLAPKMEQYPDTFHLVFELFINANEEKEYFAASSTLLTLTGDRQFNYFMQKLSKIDSISQLKYRKIAIILKCIINNAVIVKFYQENIQKLFNWITKDISNEKIFNRDMIYCLYNYLKFLIKINLEGKIIKPINYQQFTSRPDFQSILLQSSQKIKLLFNQLLDFRFDSISINLDLLTQIRNNQQLQLTTNNVIELFVENKSKLLEFINEIMNSYERIKNILDNLTEIFDFSCCQKLITVSVQIEQQLWQVINVIDQLIKLLFINMNVSVHSIKEIQCLIIILSIKIYQVLKSSESLNYIILNPNLSLYSQFTTLKMLYNINAQTQIECLKNMMTQKNISPYIKVYLNYLGNLNTKFLNLYWSDFQINSLQHSLRKEIIELYQEFLFSLENLETNHIDLNLENRNALIQFQQLSNLLNQIKTLEVKLTYLLNDIYAEDAIFLQKIVIEKLLVYLSRKFLELELETSSIQDQRQIIKKLIQYNKIEFIRSYLPTLRQEKVLEFIREMKKSTLHQPKIMLQLRTIPTFSLTFVISENTLSNMNSSTQVIAKFVIQISKYIENTVVILKYSSVNGEINTVEVPIVDNNGSIQYIVEKNNQIKYSGCVFYRGVLVLEQEENQVYI